MSTHQQTSSSTEQQIVAQARKLTAARTTDQLVADFALTDEVMIGGLNAGDHALIAMSRGWIMDELEARNPAAFAAWLETAEMTLADLRSLYQS